MDEKVGKERIKEILELDYELEKRNIDIPKLSPTSQDEEINLVKQLISYHDGAQEIAKKLKAIRESYSCLKL